MVCSSIVAQAGSLLAGFGQLRLEKHLMATIELTLDNFETTILDNYIVLVDFWADWCGPCKAFAPVFEKASEKHKDVVFVKCDTEKEQVLAAQFGIRSIPTLVIFREKVLLFAQAGALPAQALDTLIEQVKALDMTEVHTKIAEEQAQSQPLH
ncbi:MAG: thioredoxin [Rhodospirillaceae bacterium]|nr:MAG: thioredoxin [Rhodospirillaceae bacterium]